MSHTKSILAASPRHHGFAALALCMLAAGCAAEVDPADDVQVQEAALNCTPDAPAEIAVPAGNRFAFAFDAEGDQVYECRTTATGHGWVFVAPDADLFKANGNIAGTHYAGPTWEYLDGSLVVGARVAGLPVDPTAIPWLLLRAASHSGAGRMEDVTFIQRVDTAGGLAPSTSCDATNVGEVKGSPYTTTYNFFVASDAAQPPRCL